MTSKNLKIAKSLVLLQSASFFSAENRTAHTVHSQKDIFIFFQKCIVYNSVNMFLSKKCKKALFELIFTYEDNNFSPSLFYKPYETIVHKNIRQRTFRKSKLYIFLRVNFSDFSDFSDI
jgi:hypothetical protein